MLPSSIVRARYGECREYDEEDVGENGKVVVHAKVLDEGDAAVASQGDCDGCECEKETYGAEQLRPALAHWYRHRGCVSDVSLEGVLEL